MKGTVKFFNKSRGFGFIKDENDHDYFFHTSFMEDPRQIPMENDLVEFEHKQDDKGDQAIKIRILKQEEEE